MSKKLWLLTRRKSNRSFNFIMDRDVSRAIFLFMGPNFYRDSCDPVKLRQKGRVINEYVIFCDTKKSSVEKNTVRVQKKLI